MFGVRVCACVRVRLLRLFSICYIYVLRESVCVCLCVCFCVCVTWKRRRRFDRWIAATHGDKTAQMERKEIKTSIIYIYIYIYVFLISVSSYIWLEGLEGAGWREHAIRARLHFKFSMHAFKKQQYKWNRAMFNDRCFPSPSTHTAHQTCIHAGTRTTTVSLTN